MEKIAIECPSCGKELAVSSSKFGSTWTCPSCKKPMELPDLSEIEQEEPEEEPESDSVELEALEEEEEEEKPRPARGRPGDRGKKDAGPKARGRPDKARPRAAAGRGPKKGPPLLLLGIGGAALLGLIVVLVVVFAGGGGGGDKAGNGDADKPGSKDKKSSEAKERDRKISAYRERAGTAESFGDFMRLGDEAASLNLKDEAVEHYKKAAELDPESEEPLVKLGHKKYELPEEASEYPNDLLGDLPGLVGKWHPPAEHDKIKAREREIIAAAKAEIEMRQKDPFYAHLANVKSTIENSEGLRNYIFEYRRSDPYLIVEHAGKKGFNPYRSNEARELLDRKMEALKKVYVFVVDNFIKPSGLSREEMKPLVIISFEDREAMDEYQNSINMPLPPGAQAYFQTIAKHIIMFNGPGGQFGQEDSDSTLFHEATHQIFDAFCNPDGGRDVSLSLWFNEGMAEYVGSLRLKPMPDGSFEHLIAYEMKSGRLAEFYSARFPEKFAQRRSVGLKGPYALNLREMASSMDAGQNLGMVMTKWIRAGGTDPRSAGEGMRDGILATAGSLIYAQASSFMFFCFKGKPEKYKDKMMEYVRRELTGKRQMRNLQTFREIFGEDLDTIEKEWLEYVDSKTTMSIKEGHMH